MEDNKKDFNFRQRLAVFLFAVFSVFILVFLVFNFKNDLAKPFYYDKGDSKTCVDGNCSNNDSNLLDKDKDTDGDGVSDFDEINNYKTSAYLEDTDSDGILDGVEITSGTNPNCPEGEECDGAVFEEGIKDNTSPAGLGLELGNEAEFMEMMSQLAELEGSTELDEIMGMNDLNINESSDYTDDEFEDILSGGGDITKLRKLLLDAGMDSDTLDQIDDEALLETYQEILQNQ